MRAALGVTGKKGDHQKPKKKQGEKTNEKEEKRCSVGIFDVVFD